MTEFALLIDGQFREIRQYTDKPADIPHKKMTWHTVVREVGADAFTGLVKDQWVIRTIDPATLPPPVPSSITPRQCRLVLEAQGLLDTVEAMIQQQDKPTRIAWEYASEFRRNDPLLLQLAASLTPPLTREQLDQFFIAAAQL